MDKADILIRRMNNFPPYVMKIAQISRTEIVAKLPFPDIACIRIHTASQLTVNVDMSNYIINRSRILLQH